MSLEESGAVEHIETRCAECGARLTQAELRAMVENAAPPLCAIHAAEVVDVADDDPAGP